MYSTNLEPRLQKLVDIGESGIDIMHSELKNIIYKAEQELLQAQQIEEDNDYSDALESMERKYWEGQMDALAHVYALTYQLSFAITERKQS